MRRRKPTGDPELDELLRRGDELAEQCKITKKEIFEMILFILLQLVIAAILIAVVICFAKYILMWVFLIPTLLGFVLHGDTSK